MRRSVRALLALSLLAISLLAVATAPAAGAAPTARTTVVTGGVAAEAAAPPIPVTASIVGGVAHIPTGVPAAVQRAVAAANRLRHQPYVWGGGHASFSSHGYDCSGSVSFVLHAAGLLGRPLVSGALARYGTPGPGRWITIYANAEHAFMFVDGLRFDTSGLGASGPRWRPEPRSLAGFTVRHPAGL